MARAKKAPREQKPRREGMYRVTLKEAIRVGGVTLRPGQEHRIAAHVLDEHADAIETSDPVE